MIILERYYNIFNEVFSRHTRGYRVSWKMELMNFSELWGKEPIINFADLLATFISGRH